MIYSVMKKLAVALAVIAAISVIVVFAVIESNVTLYFGTPGNGQKPNPTPTPNPVPQPIDRNQSQPLNFVIILTDDQRWDSLWSMPVVQDEIVKKGVNFKNTFVTTPLCCPSRASFLSGGYYPFNTGVISNDIPNGGAPKFQDSVTMATMLQEKGYKTGLIGKYLNAYQAIAPHIPPGWSTFVTTYGPDWNKYQIVSGSTNSDKSGEGEQIQGTQYITYYVRDKGVEFIDKNANSPFFLLLSFNAPHKPATPAEEDKHLFSDYVYQSPGTLEQDLSDKPPSVRDKADQFGGDEEEASSGSMFTQEAPTADEYIRDQLRSLQAVDKSVKAIINEVEQKGLLDRTVFIFASDNGYMWGEHGLFFKAKPYEESLRVPLVIRMPGVAAKDVDNMVAMNLDVPATILNLTGIEKKTDGLDLYPLMKGTESNSSNTNSENQASTNWRDYLVFQNFGEFKNSQGWTALRTQDWKYIDRANGEKELYDLTKDPYELSNLYNDSSKNDPAIRERIENFSAMMKPLTALTISPTTLPKAELKVPYSVSLSATGGTQPYSWKLFDGSLPNGLSLSKEGVISGTPKSTTGFDKEFSVIVTDSSIATQTGKPESYIGRFMIRLAN